MLGPLLIGGLVFVAVMAVGIALVVARTSGRTPLRDRLQVEHAQRAQAPAYGSGHDQPSGLMKMLEVIGQRVGEKPTRQLEQDLARAGFHHPTAVPIFYGAKAVMLFGGLGLLTLATVGVEMDGWLRLLVIMAGAAAMTFAPNIYVTVLRQRREAEISRYVPDAIDLLEICVSSGMGLQMAWNAVADELRVVSRELADEMTLVALEAQLGVSTVQAMRHMAERTGAQELNSLTTVLVQSERFGTSISEALTTFAATLREERSMRAQETAEKLSAKLIFPMILFIFPAVIIVMAGPAFLQLMSTFAEF